MNIAGLILAFIGALLLGIAQWRNTPPVALHNANVIRMEGHDDDVQRVVRQVRAATTFGWALIALGFLFQLVAAL